MMKSFLTISKDRSGRILVSLSFDWLVEWLVKLPFPSASATAAVASAGLGVGLLVALFGQVLVRPSVTMAIPSFNQMVHTGPLVASMGFDAETFLVSEADDMTAFFALPRNKVAHWLLSGRPSEAQTVVLLVGYTHQARFDLRNVELGEEIILEGDNNGQYSYNVVTTKVVDLVELRQLTLQQQGLLLVVPQTILQREFLLIEAR